MALDRDLYAAQARRMIDAREGRQERVRRERQRFPEGRWRAGGRPRRHGGGLPPLAAAALAGGALALSALIGRRYSPDSSHPRIARWYRSLDKPSYNPPDPVFGAVWPALEICLAIGAYRLLREPSSPERNAALAFWAFNVAMIGGWTKVFFGDKNLDASLALAVAQLGSGAAYVETARRVDGTAAALGVPYTAWIAFANLLTEEVWRRNA